MNDENKTRTQTAKGGRDVKQAERDLVENNTTSFNTSFYIGIFFIVIFALGGLTWFLSIGQNKNEQTSPTETSQLLTF